MIWHFLEVWTLVAVTFAIGCVAGANLYSALAGTRLAVAQGYVADRVGDGLDRLKARVGIGPAWRPTHFRQIERPLRLPAPAPDVGIDAEDAIVVEAAAHAPPPIEAGPPEPTDVPEPEPAASPPILMARRLASVRRRAAAPVRSRPAAPLFVPGPTMPVREIVSPKRPSGISAPRGGVPDNLQRIKGIGKRNEARLNALGIFHFGQIAAWTPAELRWVGQHLELVDRIERDDWITQATVLAMGTDTGFEKSAERRRQRRRQEREFQARMTSAGVPEPDILPPRPDEVIPTVIPAEIHSLPAVNEASAEGDDESEGPDGTVGLDDEADGFDAGAYDDEADEDDEVDDEGGDRGR